MLLQKFKRKDAKTQRREEDLLKNFAPLHLCAFALILFFTSCSSPPTDLRLLAPAESLVYLETNDLGKTLENLTESKPFQQLAKRKPDFSALKNIQVAVVVTGFEASENQVTAENSVLNFKPRFVAIADTHAWNWQTLSFTESKIGQFAADILNSEVSLKKTDKSGGTFFIWSVENTPKLFAFVLDGKIFFGNDETSIEKCLAVSRGESDSFAKTGKTFERNAETLAFGYVSSEGIAQISNVAGVSAAIETTENEEGRGFIAGVLSQILKNSVKEIFWMATKTEQGIEDKFSVALKSEAASILSQTLVTTQNTQTVSAEFVPTDVFSLTRYNLQNPLISWRSLLLVASKNTDELNARVLIQNSNSLLQSYGIADAETFLSAVDSELLTVNFDAEGEKSVVIVGVKDAEKLKKSIVKMNFKMPPQQFLNAGIWGTEDKLTMAAFSENRLILGNADSVLNCLQAKQDGQNFTKNQSFKSFTESKAVAVTLGSETNSAEKIVDFLADLKDENTRITTYFLTETRYNDKGFERKTISEFGLIGDIIERFNE